MSTATTMTPTVAAVRKALRESRHRTFDSKRFIPEGVVDDLLTQQIIKEIVAALGLVVYKVLEAEERIFYGGKKTFAILILISQPHMISRFIENDQLLDGGPDGKLPFDVSTLEKVLGDSAQEFWDQQWELIAPVFSKAKAHRLLDQETIFPFTKSVSLGEGGYFGRVFALDVHTRHMIWDLGHQEQTVKVVRKEFKESRTAGESFEAEQHVLYFLNYLRHPNILELLGSYTYNGVHSLLFPYKELDLGKFMESTTPERWFPNRRSYYFAMARLISAVERLHNYNFSDLQLELIGCHRDLRPANILVEKGDFVLADFGLSKFKATEDGSASVYKSGGGFYRAPECENPVANFTTQIVTRASDIWSFGCILAELLTFILKGPWAVQEFKDRRKITLGGWLTTYTFHAGQSPNPAVSAWLDELDKPRGTVDRRLIQLIRDTLNMDPLLRPTAKSVKVRLRAIALTCQYELIESALFSWSHATYNLEARIEAQRFRLWGWAIGLSARNGNRSDFFDDLFMNDSLFDQACTRLSRIEEEFDSILSTVQQGSIATLRSPLFLNLRLLNDALHDPLDASRRNRVQLQLELILLSNADQKSLQDLRNLCEGSSAYDTIGRLAAIKLMTSLMETRKLNAGKAASLVLRPDNLIFRKSVGNQELAWLERDGQTEKQPVIVEDKKIEAHWTEAVGLELYSRVERLATLLATPSPPKFRALHALEIQGGEAEKLAPSTLDAMLHAPKPSLDVRLHLAFEIAESVLHFHKVGWLHKCITSANVLIFEPHDEPGRKEALPKPYLMGFNHSRPDEENAFTEGPSTNPNQLDYQHPEYLKGHLRYKPEYDYFSLGLVLLEIGLWKTLRSRTKKLPVGTGPEDLYEHVVKQLVPQLGLAMGSRYQEAVRFCVAGEAQEDAPSTAATTYAETSIQRHLRFDEKVVAQLRKCLLGCSIDSSDVSI